MKNTWALIFSKRAKLKEGNSVKRKKTKGIFSEEIEVHRKIENLPDMDIKSYTL